MAAFWSECALHPAPRKVGALLISRGKQSPLDVWSYSALAFRTSPRDPSLRRTMNLYRLVRRLRFFFIEVIFPHQSDPFMSCREQLSLDKGVESSIEAAPAAAEITPFEDVCRELGIPSA